MLYKIAGAAVGVFLVIAAITYAVSSTSDTPPVLAPAPSPIISPTPEVDDVDEEEEEEEDDEDEADDEDDSSDTSRSDSDPRPDPNDSTDDASGPAVVPTTRIVSVIGAAIEANSDINARVECPGTIEVAEGNSIQCDAYNADTDQHVRSYVVTITDADGNFTWSAL